MSHKPYPINKKIVKIIHYQVKLLVYTVRGYLYYQCQYEFTMCRPMFNGKI